MMRRVELIEDIFLIILIVIVFGTVFSVTLAFKDTQEPTVVYVATPVQADVTDKAERVQNAAAPGILFEEPEEISKSTPIEEVSEPKKDETAEKITPAKSNVAAPVAATKTTPTKQSSVTNNDANLAYMQELASLIEAETNAFRKKNGLPALKSDGTLAQNARAHSRQMLSEDFFSHTNSSGCDFTCRFKASGYDAQTWGENLGQYSFSDFPSAESVASYFMKGWQKSSGHRENLLGDAFTYQGVGIAMDNKTIYVTVDFAQPMPR